MAKKITITQKGATTIDTCILLKTPPKKGRFTMTLTANKSIDAHFALGKLASLQGSLKSLKVLTLPVGVCVVFEDSKTGEVRAFTNGTIINKKRSRPLQVFPS